MSGYQARPFLPPANDRSLDGGEGTASSGETECWFQVRPQMVELFFAYMEWDMSDVLCG